jgi:hypothetical protein
MIKALPVILFLSVVCIRSLYAQGEIDEQKKIFYRNERTFGIIINTDGYGPGFRYAKRLDATRKSTYEVEFSYVKDEEEAKVSQYSSNTLGSSFVPGKVNAFFTLRGGIGYQKELFQKRDKGGISIRYFYNFGPVLGILKPIYYRVIDSTGQEINVKFDLDAVNNIEGRAPFFKGIDEISLVPGAYCKFGFTFEFSKSDKMFNAIETGVALNVFTKKVPIMADNDNQFAFFTFFLSYRFGKIIDAQFNSSVNKIDEIAAPK